MRLRVGRLGLRLEAQWFFGFLCLYKNGERLVCLTPSLLVRGPSIRPFDEAVYERRRLTAYAGLDSLGLSPGLYDAVVYSARGESVASCRLPIGSSAATVTCRLHSSWSGGLVDPVVRALAGVDEELLESIALQLGLRGPPASRVWRIAWWLEENTVYDHAKAVLGDRVLSPREFLVARRGVCIDYAVFSSTALLAAGLSEPHIVLLEGGSEGHAVALARLGGEWFVVDQRRPVAPWHAYAEAYYGGTPAVKGAYRVALSKEGGVVVELSRSAPRPAPATPGYGGRGLEELRGAIAASLEEKLGARHEPALDMIPRLLSIGLFLSLGAPRLSGAPGEASVPLTRLYHPILRWEWGEWLAQRLRESMRAGEPIKSFGLALWEDGVRTTLGLYTLPWSPPPTRIALEPQGLLRVVIEAPVGLQDIDIIVYDGNRPVAGIAPRGYRYQRLDTIVALRWETAPARTIVEARPPPRYGRGVVAVYYHGRPVAAKPLQPPAPR